MRACTLELNARFMLVFFSIYQSGFDDIIMATFPHSFRGGGGNGLGFEPKNVAEITSYHIL